MVKSYLKTIHLGFTSFSAYLSFLYKPWIHSLLYFVSSMFLLGFLQATLFITLTMPTVIHTLAKLETETISHFPDHTRIEWNQQELTLNDDSLTIPYPSPLKQLIEIDSTIPLAIVSPTSAQPMDASSYLFVTKDTLFISDLTGSWNSWPLRDIPGFDQNFSITKDSIDEITQAVKTYVSAAFTQSQWLLFIVFPLFLILFSIWQGIGEVFLAFLMFRINGIQLTLGQIIKLYLFISVPAQTMQIIGRSLYPTLAIPYFTITFWIILIGLLWSTRYKLQMMTKQS